MLLAVRLSGGPERARQRRSSGALLQTLEGHTSEVRAVSMTHDMSRIVLCSEDFTVRVWDKSLAKAMFELFKMVFPAELAAILLQYVGLMRA